MIKYLLNKLCNLFGYTITPMVQLPDTPMPEFTWYGGKDGKQYNAVCVKATDENCDCAVCLPW